MNIIEQKLRDYRPLNAVDQEIALTEIVQQMILFGLSRAGLFNEAAFHGGTCLRILFGLRRFSEDLDFILKEPRPDFSWARPLSAVAAECRAYGVELEIHDREQAVGAVRAAFLKTGSIGKVLVAHLPFTRHPRQKIKVKLEIDVDPPMGSHFESRFLTFPSPAAITTLDLASGFSGKLHALLCRTYIKGRDWYDLLWYAERGAAPNVTFLRHAIRQQGPWKGRTTRVDHSWILNRLGAKIREIDWPVVRRDVERFIPSHERKGLEMWNAEFFRVALERLSASWIGAE